MEEQRSCNVCGEEFKSPEGCAIHKGMLHSMKHIKEQFGSYICPYCGTFVNGAARDAHERIHSVPKGKRKRESSSGEEDIFLFEGREQCVESPMDISSEADISIGSKSPSLAGDEAPDPFFYMEEQIAREGAASVPAEVEVSERTLRAFGELCIKYTVSHSLEMHFLGF